MNKLTDKLQKIHEEWQQSTRLALAAVRDEQKAKSLAADKFSVQLMEMIPEIVQRMTSLERQMDWLISYYEKHNHEFTCPYLAGCFDQAKPCPFWTSYSGEQPENDSRKEWYELLIAPVNFGDDYIDCKTSLNVCLRFAAEKAAGRP